MFINSQIDSDFKTAINDIDWLDLVPETDKEKYKQDPTFNLNFKNEIYNKYSVEIEDFISKICDPLIRNGMIVKLQNTKMFTFPSYEMARNRFCELRYTIKVSENEKTNSFSADLRFFAEKAQNKVIVYWEIYGPRRREYRENLNWACTNYCNAKLFTSRGFKRVSYQTYLYASKIEDWNKIDGYCDSIIKHLNKTIIDLKNKHEKIQKQINIKEKLRKIQFDDVYSAVYEINAKIKDINAKFIIDEFQEYDKIDSPIQFFLRLTNNPEQNREDLYNDTSKLVFVDENNFENENKIKLFSHWFGTGPYYSSKYRIRIRYYNNCEKPWKLDLYNWCLSEQAFNIIYGKQLIDFNDIDTLKNYILYIIDLDNKLYNNNIQWIKNAYGN